MRVSLKTGLFSCYSTAEGVKIVDYAGWALPMRFSGGIVAEHRAVRSTVGLFDVSHMGRIAVEGSGSTRFVDWLTTNTLPDERRARYSFLCAEDGGCVDDVLVYRFGEESYELVVNAVNRGEVMLRLVECRRILFNEDDRPAVIDRTTESCQIAVQGPRAAEVVSSVCSTDVTTLRNYEVATDVRAAAGRIVISRTGYTGEDGYELFSPLPSGPRLWNGLVAEGRRYGVEPCGLGARDSLRFEAGLPLYGHELDRCTNPVEASLARFVDFTKGEFCGRKALLAAASGGARRKRIGLELVDRGVPRSGDAVYRRGRECGVVTSGGKCHTVGIFAAMAFVPTEGEDEGFEIAVREKLKAARLRSLPFYRRRRE